MRLPLACVYVSGFICSVGMVAIALNNLYRLVARKMDESELVMTVDSEEQNLVGQALEETGKGEEKS